MFPDVFSLSSASLPTGVAVTEEMLQPVVDGITSNIAVAIPVCIVIMGILVGIGLVFKLIRKAAKA